MRVEFFPCDERYKNPVGGVEVNADFTVSAVCDEANEAYFVLTKESETPVRYPMKDCGGGKFSFTMRVTSSGLYFYHFAFVVSGEERKVFANEDLCASESGKDEWQLTAYKSRYRAPEFLRGGIFYQIMPDRFNRGGKRYKTKKNAVYREDTSVCPYYLPDENGIVRNNDMFGGNLDGVTEKLDYLKSLSVKCIYLNPVFEAASNHKYDTGSYRRVDGDFGGEDALKNLIKEAEKRGIKVILDGVFSHTGDDSVYFNRYGNYDSVGAYQSEHSPYFDWYDFNAFPSDYKCWWGIKILPCVNETNVRYDEFINGEDGIIRYYMRMGIAGWRLDVADELPDAFIDNLTRAAKSVNPEALVLGEVWEDASNKTAYGFRRRYLQGAQLDSVTNYPFKNAVIDFVNTGDAKGLKRTVCRVVNNYPKRVLDNLMNFLGTHDTVRILNALSSDSVPKEKSARADYKISDRELAVQKLKAAAALQYTLPGVPCLYYGDEAGMEGYEDPFNRRFFPWLSRDESLTDYYRALGKLRALKELNGGSIKIINAEKGVFSFVRGASLKIVSNMGKCAYELSSVVTDLITGEELSVLSPLKTIAFY